MTEQMIIDAYCLMRKIDNTIPDDVLDFMKESALERLRNSSKKSTSDIILAISKDIESEISKCQDIIEETYYVRSKLEARAEAKAEAFEDAQRIIRNHNFY